MISQSREHSLLEAIAEDPSRKVAIPQGRSYLANPPGTTFWQGVASWMFTLDHKRIGVMYLCGVMFAFLLGGIFAGAVRLELWNGTPDLLKLGGTTQDAQDNYNQMFTLHGAVMTFLFIIPSIPAALGNIFLPMMLGAKDVAFPRMNLASFYLWCGGAIFFVATLLSSGLDTGWTFYTPYSTSTSTSVILATMGVFILGFSSIFTGVNFVVTVNTMRPKGMTWFKMPLFLWGIYSTAIIQVLATPVLAITLVLLMCERMMGIGIFDPSLGGDPVLFQHFFWFYSHPAVYIMILPGMAIISEVIPVYSRKHIFGYTFIAYSSVAIALLGFLVWGHHMFTSTESKLAAVIFSALTFTVSIPSAIKVFNWLTTMYKGAIHLNAAMLYALAFMVQFTIGGLTGLFLGALAVDVTLHDTYFVVAHFHYVMMGSTLIAFLSGIHHWWPKMFGRMYNETLAAIACGLVFWGFNQTFFPQFILGTQGMPRRYAAYKPEFAFLHQVSTVGYFILGAGLLLAALVLIYSLFRGKKAPANPWGAATLEWKCCSPPTTANFEVQPWVGDPYDYDSFVFDPDEGGYVEVLPDLHRDGSPVCKPAIPATLYDSAHRGDAEDAELFGRRLCVLRVSAVISITRNTEATMADAATLDAPTTDPHAAGHGHDDHDHGHGHPSLAHHFEDLDQQFNAGKLGMWLFLAQEVLFFSGLFAAYTVFRWHYPEVFVDAHHHLNKTLGAVNTIVLLASSLAIAWGVRAAMRNDRRTILNTHVFTLGCAALFLGVKAIEYTHKWDEGIGAGNFYKYVEGSHPTQHYWGSMMPGLTIWSLVIGAVVILIGARWAANAKVVKGWVTGSIGVCILSFGLGIVLAKCIMPTPAELARQEGHGAHAAAPGDAHSDMTHADEPAELGHAEATAQSDAEPTGVSMIAQTTSAANPGAVDGYVADHEPEPEPREPRFGAANFFSIYFVMTGVHAVHIIGGIIAITWVIAKAAAGEFSAEYFLPVENVGLYWHLVDLVWIYLFPLMYLIH